MGSAHFLLLHNFLKNIMHVNHQSSVDIPARRAHSRPSISSRPAAGQSHLHTLWVSTCHTPYSCWTSARGLKPSQTKETEVPSNGSKARKRQTQGLNPRLSSVLEDTDHCAF